MLPSWNGVVLDATAPTIAAGALGWPRDDPTPAIPDALVSNNLTHAIAAFAFADPESDVTTLQAGIMSMSTYRGAAYSTAPLFVNTAATLSALTPDVKAFVTISNKATYVELPYPNGASAGTRAFAVVFRVLNSLGMESRFRTTGVVVDSSAPVCTPTMSTLTPRAQGSSTLDVALDGPGDGVTTFIAKYAASGSASKQATAGELHARFFCIDSESSIVRVSAAVLLLSGSSYVSFLPARVTSLVRNESQAIASVVDARIVPGYTYKLSLEVVNGAGSSTTFLSRGVQVIVAAPPNVAAVNFSAPGMVDGYVANCSALRLNISSITVGSGLLLNKVTYAVGRALQDAQVVGVTSVATSTAWLFSAALGLSPSSDGFPLYASVMAENDLRQITTVVSEPVICDSTPPVLTASSIRTLLDIDAVEAGSGATSLRVNITSLFMAYDMQSSVASVRVALLLGSTTVTSCARTFLTAAEALACVAQLPTLVSWQNINVDVQEVTHTNVLVSVSASVRTGVLVSNGAGRTTVSFGNAAASMAAAIRAEAIMPGSVFDGSASLQSLRATTSRTTLAASWRGFGAPAVTEIAFGTQPGGADLCGGSFLRVHRTQPRAGFGSTTLFMNTTELLPLGTVVYATVRASDASGSETVEVTSSGITVVPPAVAAFVGFGQAVGDTVLGFSSPNVWVNWVCTGLDLSPVQSATLSLVSASTGGAVLATRRVTRAAAVQGAVKFSLSAAAARQQLFAVCTCSNGAEAGDDATRTSSTPAFVDTTPPVLTAVRGGGSLAAPNNAYLEMLVIDSSSVFVVEWDAFDNETSIIAATLCIGNAPGGSDVLPCHTTALNGTTVASLRGALAGEPSALNADIVFTEALPAESVVYIRVSLMNGAGLESSMEVPAFVVVQAPTVVDDALYFTADTESVASVMDTGTVAPTSRNMLPVVWTPFAAGSLTCPLSTYTLSLYLTSAGAQAAPIAQITLSLNQLSSIMSGSMLTFSWLLPPTLTLSLGVSYRFVVLGADACGLRGSISKTFTIPSTAPSITDVTLGAPASNADASAAMAALGLVPTSPEVYDMYGVWPLANALVVSWQFGADDGATFEWTVCPAANATDAAAATVAGAPLTCGTPTQQTGTRRWGVRLDLALTHGERYVVRVAATSSAGARLVAVSSTFMVDLLPPIAPSVFEWPDAATSLVSARILLGAFNERESGPVLQLEMALGTAPEEEDVMPWAVLPPSLLASKWSPNVGAFRITTADVVESPTFNSLLASVAGSNELRFASLLNITASAAFHAALASGNASVHLGIRATSLVGLRTTIWSMQPMSIVSARLTLASSSNTTLAWLMAGLESDAMALEAMRASRGVMFVDSVDAAARPWRPLHAVADASQLAVTWLPVAASSGAVEYSLKIGTQRGGEDVLTLTSFGDATSVNVSSEGVPNGMRLHATVVARNALGASLTLTSNPTGLLVDGQSPIVGTVYDGVGPTDADFVSSTTEASARWSVSDETALTYAWTVCYANTTAEQLQVENSTDAHCLVDWQSVGRATWGKLSGGVLLMTSGSVYRSWLAATDAAGNVGLFSSDGFTVRTEPVEAHDAIVSQPDAVSSWENLTAEWTGFYSPVGMASYNVTATFVGGTTRLQLGPLPVGLVTRVTQLSAWMSNTAVRDFTTLYAAWEAGLPAGKLPAALLAVSAIALNGRQVTVSSAASSVIDATPLSVPQLFAVDLAVVTNVSSNAANVSTSALQAVGSTRERAR
ncbi:MAG: hypothetical protein EOO65_00380, partial [Methanosarcinales archaeon]